MRPQSSHGFATVQPLEDVGPNGLQPLGNGSDSRYRVIHLVARDLTAYLLIAYAFTIPFHRIFQFGGVGSAATVAGGLAAVAGAFALLTGPVRNGVHRMHVMAAALTMVTVLSLAWSSFPTASFDSSLRGLGPGDALRTVQLLLITWMIWEFVERRRYVQLVCGYVLGANIAASWSIFRWLRDGGEEGNERFTASAEGQLNITALVLALGIPLAWWALQHVRSRLVMLMLAGYLMLGPVAILLTASRSGSAAALFAVIALIASASQLRLRQKAVLLVAVVAAVILSLNIVPDSSFDRVGTVVTDEETTEEDLGTRENLWRIGLDAFGEEPIVGGGRGIVRAEAKAAGFDLRFSSHNTWINVAAEFGILGLVPFVLMYLSLFGIFRVGSRFDRWIAVGLFSAFFASSMVINFELEKANWLLLAILAGHLRFVGETPTERYQPLESAASAP